ncbi:MAG: TonB-dependent receptor, partial [Hyphomicrobium sp.]|nr:TonB-dependent receptor [Hyphomicrobium sp.]
GYAYLDGRVVNSVGIDSGQPIQGKRPTLTPGHSGSLWLSKAVGGGWRLGGGASFVGNRFANPGNTVTLPRYTVFDAGAFYRVKGLDLGLNVKNLFDRKFIVAGHGTNANLNLPGAPRSVQMTLRYAF